ncbi:hypothetical protein GCM10023224_07260 [Streptomonospora halophila]|uniref:Uncharacterized protein n=1 Tax=Streptomonospora halophila TaxID=427369 RepID=A0ABP9GF49_9ACTN
MPEAGEALTAPNASAVVGPSPPDRGVVRMRMPVSRLFGRGRAAARRTSARDRPLTGPEDTPGGAAPQALAGSGPRMRIGRVRP